MEVVILEKEALLPPDNERALLADKLLESPSRRPAELEDVWVREADSRMAAFLEGTIESVAAPDAMAELRKKFPR